MAEDSEWLHDSVLEFFRSPLWKNPIQHFIDENCVIFDCEDENKFEYSTVHKAFTELVEGLLEFHLNELGIPAQQFIDACTSGDNNELSNLVVNTILQMDDFMVFKKMMQKRNMQLELEAVKALGTKNIAHGGDEEVQDALRRSKDEIEKLEEEERRLIEAAIQASLADQSTVDQSDGVVEDDKEKAATTSVVEPIRIDDRDRGIMVSAQRRASISQQLSPEDMSKEKDRIFEEHMKNMNELQQQLGNERTKQECSLQQKIQEKRAQKMNQTSPPLTPLQPESKKVTTTALPPVRLPGRCLPKPSTAFRFPTTETSVPTTNTTDSRGTSTAAAAAPTPASEAVQEDRKANSTAVTNVRVDFLKEQKQKIIDLKRQQREQEMAVYSMANAGKPGSSPAPPVRNEEEIENRNAGEERNTATEMRLALTRKLKHDLLNQSFS